MRLRYFLTLLFTLVASVPVAILGIWVANTALDREISEVRERHLLLATNITAAIERYVQDSRAAFDAMLAAAVTGHTFDDLSELGRKLDFIHFCLVSPDGRIERQARWSGSASANIDEAMFARVRGWAETGMLFGPVFVAGKNGPAIPLVRRLDDGRIAFALLSTSYIVQLQRAVAFGKKGHAAIVDRDGNVMAHPRSEWRDTVKNIAKVKPVAAMMRGERGVTTFFSPAMQKDMIAGYTAVPGVGWGVMVPQPMEELEARAGEIRDAALLLTMVALLAAAFLSWWVSGLLTRPVDDVLAAAKAIAGGQLDARARLPARFTPRELRELAEGFNGMAKRIFEDQERMVSALEQARKADRAKSTFLANMSHEFRTPLNAIIGFSDTMQTQLFGPLGDNHYVEYAEDINRSGHHLLAIVNDILDLSKIEAGKLELEKELVDVNALLESALALVAAKAEDGKVRLHAEIADGLPPVRGSDVKLRQVALNLLANAVRFTPAGGEIAVTADAGAGDEIELHFRDTGIGMTPEQVSTALLPFTQVDGDLSRRHDGTGLGLPLSQRLVELHGGRMRIDSVPGKGTDVVVTLPAVSRAELGEAPPLPRAKAV